MEKIDFCTIMTPTYNRGYIITNLYKSLKKQTCKSFEWLVIDDGSTDNTEDIFKNLIHDDDFKIRYYKVENGGKHRAINFALDKAKGEYFFIVDSDDQLTENAIEIVLKWFNTIKESSEFAGIGGLKQYSDGNIIGSTFYGDFLDCTSLERKKNNILGDKAEVFYTKILKMNKFPEISGEKFLSESVVWNKIAKSGLKIRWFNQAIYTCDYLNDGLTKNLLYHHTNSPVGFSLYLLTVINDEKVSKIRELYYYGMYSKLTSINDDKVSNLLKTKKINVKFGKFLYFIISNLKKIKKTG